MTIEEEFKEVRDERLQFFITHMKVQSSVHSLLIKKVLGDDITIEELQNILSIIEVN